jgi:acyl-CoA hydrolase
MTNDYRSKMIDPMAAINLVRSGSRVVASMAAAEPSMFFEHLADRARMLDDVVVYCANPSRNYECFHAADLVGRLDMRTMFLTASIRSQQGGGLVHYVPQHLSQWSRHLLNNQSIDVFWGSCSTPDERGFVTLGTGACYEPEILRAASIVILEINPQMPCTFGGTLVPISMVTHFIENSHPLTTVEASVPTTEDKLIGQFVASLIGNGSTIQLGIGAIPNAIASALEQHKDLGVHTEMINDAMMNLHQLGVINGRRKTLWPGKMVGAFVFGSCDLYKFVHQNPAIELHPASVVNDPHRIGRNFQMVSLNTAVEIDLTGQCCSESIGHKELSGVGGASETHTGAQRSHGGRGIIALRSCTTDGLTSKICFELKAGAKVSISRNDIDTVVTEFGVAKLAGKSVCERVKSMIAVAHPRFRDELMSEARRARYL